MKKAERHFATTALGIIVALGIVASQLFYIPQQSSEKEKIKTTQSHDDSSEDEVYFSVPSSTVPSSAHVELNPNVFFLFEIFFEEKEIESTEFKISIPVSRCFRTLFGLAISPNAP